MKILLDTCVLSEIRHPSGNPLVKQVIARISDDDLFLSVLTIGELAKGIALLPAGRRKNELLSWSAGLRTDYSDRILPVDLEVALIWGSLTARLKRIGIGLPTIDGLLAATALHHGLHLMTRNTRHFESTGVMIVDPWQS